MSNIKLNFTLSSLLCIFALSSSIHAEESTLGISGNPGSVNVLAGTGELGKWLHIPKDSGVRLGGIWLGDYNALAHGGTAAHHHRRWTGNSSFILDLYLVITTTGFAENLVLENQTSYPSKTQKTKIAIQWANSAKDVDENNTATIRGLKLNSDTLQVVNKTGTVNMSIPKNAAYFRVLAWSNTEKEPDLLTNWVDIVPNKTYTLKTDHLVPSVLMIGTGC